MAARAKARGWGGGESPDSKHYGHERRTENNTVICECGEVLGMSCSIVVGPDLAAWALDDEPDQPEG